MRRFRSQRPAARTNGLLVEQVGYETVVYDTETKHAHCLNPLAAALFSRCDGRTSVDELAAAASEGLGEPVDVASVEAALAQLEARQLLVTEDVFSRREMIRRTALTGAAAAAAPVIVTIMAPTPAAAATPTCGDILCCACFQGQPPDPSLPKQGQQCCIHPTAIQCNCTAAETGGCKQCKPQGPAANEVRCREIFGSPPFPPSASCPCARELIPDCAAVT